MDIKLETWQRVALINSLTRVQKRISDLTARIVSENKLIDLSDLGNEIGIAVGKELEALKKAFPDNGFEGRDFVAGIEHGLSLEDGTH